MTPGSGHSVLPDAYLDTVHMHRTIIAAANVVFARPDQFDWSPTETPGDQRSFAWYMRIGNCAAPETTARELSVKSNLFGFETEHLSDHRLVHRLKLRGDPRFRLVTFVFDRSVKWFHRRVGQVRKLVLGSNSIRAGNTIHRFGVPA